VLLSRQYIPQEAEQKLRKAQELNKYYMARDVWRKREQKCPVPQQVGRFKQMVTWEEWFKIKFGESLFDYAERIKRDGKPEGVVAMADGGHK
jgi:hypothetical protein